MKISSCKMTEIEWSDDCDERFLELIDNVRSWDYDQLLDKNTDNDEDSLIGVLGKVKWAKEELVLVELVLSE